MPDDISATGWLVILCALALGFGVVRFMIVSMNDKLAQRSGADANPSFAPSLSQGPTVEPGIARGGNALAEPRAWHEVLGVASAASTEDIHAAYQKKISQYHPDKVSSVGPEFTVMAERMTNEVNTAYAQALRLRGEEAL